MSASPDKKAQARAQRDEKRRREEQKDRRTMALYTTISVVVIIAAAALIFWNSGILQRNVTALNVNGTKYTAAEVQYYYKSLYNQQANSYAFLPNVSVKEQVYDQETGQSWYDYLMDQTIDTITTNTALASQAQAELFERTAEGQAELETFLAQLNTGWLSYGYSSRDAFIKANFGPYMTYERLVSLVNMEFLASDYANARLDAIQHPDSDYEAYYQDNAGSLDTIIYTQLTFRAGAPTTDDQGNPVELTDEEKAAAIEEQKPVQKALAEEVQARLEAGEDVEAVAEEYEEQLYSTALSRRASGVNVSMSIYSDWLMDSVRKTGDVTLVEQETVDSYYYYVSVFEDRFRDEENTNTVRHLLVRAGSGTGTPTQEQYDEAEKKAQELLDQWKAGEATEDSFAQLAAANSQDTGSAASGGLISGITSTSSYVQPFKDWATDSSRKAGDVELVKSDYGWHIMYYVSSDDPAWKITVGSALRTQDLEQLSAEASQGLNVTQGFGMKFITA
ncbi:MAG: hypothetical protein HFF44_09520 [Lawsonibacter sp.]|nr:hypothetical protein [Lawsonibacter sp.]